MTCPVCFDDMDMRDFNDQRASTETCFKLECGHSFHTKCIVQFLTRTQHKCPSCNKHKTPEEKLQMEGQVRNLLRTIKTDERVRLPKREYVIARTEYKAALETLKKDALQLVRKRAAELKIKEHKNHYYNCVRAVISGAKEVAREREPKFVSAIESQIRTNVRNHYTIPVVSQELFGVQAPGHRDWKLRNPRFYCSVIY